MKICIWRIGRSMYDVGIRIKRFFFKSVYYINFPDSFNKLQELIAFYAVHHIFIQHTRKQYIYDPLYTAIYF